MRRIIGPVLAVIGIVLVVGLVAGIAYSAGLAAAGVVTTTGVAPGAGTTVVAPVVAYGWWGLPWFGFGIFHFLAFLFVIFLVVGLIRFAVGGGRRGPRGWGYGHGYGPGGWNGGPEGGTSSTPGDPREAWIRSRLDEWHRTAHAGPGPTPGTPATPDTAAGETPAPPSA